MENHKTVIPNLLVSDKQGNFFEIPELLMTGVSLDTVVLPKSGELIPIPAGSDLFRLPGRVPVGFDPVTQEYVEVDEYQGVQVEAVGAFMSPAYLQIYRAAYETLEGAPALPLYCYTAAGWKKNGVYVTGMRIDNDNRQDYENFDNDLICKKAKELPAKFPGNRLVKHLVENCVLRYGCPAARNFVMGRWECPVPTSRTCNAACLGCISLQPKSSGFPASHERICFTPTVEEIVEFVVPHLQTAARPVASFGQGCEGEPLLEGELLAESILQIRKLTSRGIINVNTNASRPDVVEKLCKAGLDSMRVSMSSAREPFYNAYYQPKDYTFSDVISSLEIARKYNKWTSLNYLTFSGFTDTTNEITAFENLIKRVELNMIQTRNLNIDPVWYIKKARLDEWDHGKTIGMKGWVKCLQTHFPNLKLGYFNPPLAVMEQTIKKGKCEVRL
jgi:wyosine [tRNA(Phe)-imidazoG37] synthetase (radical SAM superfamily)